MLHWTSPGMPCAKNETWPRSRRSPQACGNRPLLAHGGPPRWPSIPHAIQLSSCSPRRSRPHSRSCFLYRHVLERDIGLLEGVVRAKRPGRVPVVLNRRDVQQLLAHLDDVKES